VNSEGWHDLAGGEARLASGVLEGNIAAEGDKSPTFKSPCPVLVFVLTAFCWTKSLLCNVVVFTGMPYILESSSYLEFISLR
jgi:hypothetical protein